MYNKGHIGINMILFSPVLFIMIILEFFVLGIVGLISVIYFASLPDIDLKVKRLKHRGFTHTISFAVLMGLISLFIAIFINSIVINIGFIHASLFNLIFIPVYGFFIGFFIVMGHIMGDIITPSGVRIFKKPKYVPNLSIFSDKKYSLNLIKAKNIFANVLFLFVGILFTSMSIFVSMFLFMF